VLDLKDAGDLARLRTLLADADVLVENFRPGVMDRLGLGADALEELNERLVVLSITGFGEGGPDGHRSGFDQIIQGEAGLMGITGPVGGPPTKFGVPITDILSGMFGAYGVVAALHERERTGKGQRVTTSLLAAAVAVHTYQGTRWTLGGEVPAPGGNRHPTIAPYGAFTCADGWVNVAVGSEGLWQRFAPVVGLDRRRPALRDQPRPGRQLGRARGGHQRGGSSTSRSRPGWPLEEAGVPAGGSARWTRSTPGTSSPTSGSSTTSTTRPRATSTARRAGAVVAVRSARTLASRVPPTLGQHDDEVLGRVPTPHLSAHARAPRASSPTPSCCPATRCAPSTSPRPPRRRAAGQRGPQRAGVHRHLPGDAGVGARDRDGDPVGVDLQPRAGDRVRRRTAGPGRLLRRVQDHVGCAT
jgi:crotonobetainyl-CoA:carnitine CoA-transferase CaiB-like acyl-CoA transferase